MSILISFISQSGNVAKSTLAFGMAVESVNNKLPVAIADLDHEHRTITDLLAEREEFGISPLFTVYPVKTAKEALNCFNDESLKIIDCPSRASKATIEISKHSNLVVQPTTCAKKDLNNAIQTFYQLADNGVAPERMLFVLTRVGSEAEYKKALAYLGQVDIGGNQIQILSSPFWEKMGYRNAVNDGFSITETQYPSLNESAKAVIHQILSFTINK